MSQIQSTETEPEIVHLDFDPEVPEPEKEPEEPKKCGLNRVHPYDTETHPCGRPAVYQVSLKKSCGHVSDTYLCQGCWNEVEQNPVKQWKCIKDGCNTNFHVRPVIVRWEKL